MRIQNIFWALRLLNIAKMKQRIYPDEDENGDAYSNDDETCFAGQQGIIAFLGCLCGSFGALLFHSWLYTTLTLYCGVSWGSFAVSTLDKNKRLMFKSLHWLVLNSFVSLGVVLSVSYCLLDIKNFFTIILVSTVSTAIILYMSDVLHKLLRTDMLKRLPISPINVKHADDNV